jgi:hypothetical protein
MVALLIVPTQLRAAARGEFFQSSHAMILLRHNGRHLQYGCDNFYIRGNILTRRKVRPTWRGLIAIRCAGRNEG